MPCQVAVRLICTDLREDEAAPMGAFIIPLHNAETQ